jgi:hypothetical protein
MDAVNQATLAVGSAPDDFVDYGELENVPLYQLAQQWKDENLQFLIQSPLTAILSLKLHFDQIPGDAWHQEVSTFLINELSFYFRLSAVRPSMEKWENLINSLPRGNAQVWQSWLRRQIVLLLELDEELLKAVYYYYARYRKKGENLVIADLLSAYHELSQQGRFVLDDFQKVAQYFDQRLKKQEVFAH